MSYDGIPFLLHDPHTIRTTDVVSKCPDVDPLGNATWLNFTTGTCPLDQLNVGSWFTKQVNYTKPTLIRWLYSLVPRPLRGVRNGLGTRPVAIVRTPR